jgi:hypothetical protein
MNVVKRRTICTRKTNKHKKISLSSLLNHCNENIKSRKVGPTRILAHEEDAFSLQEKINKSPILYPM